MNPVIEMTWEEGADASFGLPAYATPGAAGADLRANFLDRGDVIVQPGARLLIGTGLRLAIPAGYEVQIRPRSGLALKHGITLANAPGTIDSDYRGALGVILLNTGTEPFRYVMETELRKWSWPRWFRRNLLLCQSWTQRRVVQVGLAPQGVAHDPCRHNLCGSLGHWLGHERAKTATLGHDCGGICGGDFSSSDFA